MIEIFKMSHSVEASEVGNFPQVEEKWLGPGDYQDSGSYSRTPLKGPINFDIIFPKFEIARDGKLTDWAGSLNINRNYLMITTRLYDLLKTFQMDEYQYFPAPVHTPNRIVDYHLIYFPWPRGDDFIDWQRSTFRRIAPSGDSF